MTLRCCVLPYLTTLLLISLILASLEGCQSRYVMPAAPQSFPPPTPTLTFSPADLPKYHFHWKKAKALYEQGHTDQALKELITVSTLGSKMQNAVATDTAIVDLQLAQICWFRRQPGCAYDNFEAAANSDRLPQHLATEARAFATSLYRLRFAPNPSWANAVKWRVPRNLGITGATKLYDSGLRAESKQKWGSAWKDFSRLAQLLKVVSSDLTTDAPTVELAKANALTATGNTADAIALYRDWLTNREVELGLKPSDREVVDEHNSLLFAHGFAKEESLFQDWLKDYPHNHGDQKPTKQMVAVKETLAPLLASAWLKTYRKALSDVKANNWQQALHDFNQADRYLPMPVDDLGLARSIVQLSPRCYSLTIAPPQLNEALSLLNEYLARSPKASDRDEVEANIRELKKAISDCENGTDFINPVLRGIGGLYLRAVQESVAKAAYEAEEGLREYPKIGVTVTVGKTQQYLSAEPPPPAGVANRSPASATGGQNFEVFASSTGHLTVVPTVTFQVPFSVMPDLSWHLSSVSITSAPRQTIDSLPSIKLVLPPNAPFRSKNIGRSIEPSAIEPGDLIVSRDDGLTSLIIRTAEGYTPNEGVSHVMLSVGNGWVVEAVGEGVQLLPLSTALKGDNYAAVFRDRKLTNPSAAIAFAMSKIGMKYNFVGVITHPRFGLFRLGKLQTTDHFFCSELVADAYKAAGTPLFLPPSASSPADYPALGFVDGIKYVGTLIGPVGVNPIKGNQSPVIPLVFLP